MKFYTDDGLLFEDDLPYLPRKDDIIQVVEDGGASYVVRSVVHRVTVVHEHHSGWLESVRVFLDKLPDLVKKRKKK